VRRRWIFRGPTGELIFVHRSDIDAGTLGGDTPRPAFTEPFEAWRLLRAVIDRAAERDGQERAAAVEMLEAAGHARFDVSRASFAKIEPLLREAVLHGMIVMMRGASRRDVAAREARPEPPPTPATKAAKPTTWVGVEVSFEDGTPYTGKYEIKLPDGSKRSGVLTQDGSAYFDGIEPGDCEITFPDLPTS